MPQIAGLQDFRAEGPPGDIGIFQGTTSIIVYRFTFSGVTYYVAQRMGVQGWTLVGQGTVASTVINSALGALTVGRTWQEKVVLKGLFSVDGDILVPSYTVLDLSGAKIDSSQAGASAYIITNSDQVAGNTDIEIVGGEVDGNDATGNNSVGIFFVSVTRGLIENTYIHHLSGSPAYGVRFEHCVNVDVTQCRFDNCDRSSVQIAHGCYRCNVIDCKSIDSGDGSAHYVVYGDADAGCYQCDIVDCETSGGSGWSAQIYRYAYDCKVIGGNFYSNDLECVALGHESWVNTCHNLAAIGNTICNASAAITVRNAGTLVEGNHIYDSATGVWVYATVTDCSVNGNELNISGATGQGILIASSYNLIEDNKIYGAPFEGIRLASGATFNLINDNHITVEATGSRFDIHVLSGATNNDIYDNYLAGSYGIYIESGANNNRIGINDLSNATTKFTDLGTGTILPTVRASFVKELGTAVWVVTAANPMGIDIDAADEGALAKIQLPLDLQQVVRIRVVGIAQALETHGMQLMVAAGACIDNETWNAEAISVASKTSSTLNFASGDKVQWMFTSADDADIGHLVADDFLQWCCYYAAVSGDNCATDLLLAGEALEIQYV